MDIDATLARVKELTTQREAIDRELAGIFGGQAVTKRAPPKCGTCGAEGHRSNQCPSAGERPTGTLTLRQ